MTSLGSFILPWTVLLPFLLFAPRVDAFIDKGGLCTLFTYVPFTFNESHPTTFLPTYRDDKGLFNQGFEHMVAALMAMEHFNSRNALLVPELAQLGDCNIRFDMTTSAFFDTGSITHMAIRSWFESNVTPCAIAGPYNDIPGNDLSAVALGAGVPLVAHRAHDTRIVSNHISPFSNQVFPAMNDGVKRLVQFLRYKGRTDFISLVYAGSDVGLQRREKLSIELDYNEMKWASFGYLSTLDNNDDFRSIPTVLRQAKQRGYRTIVVAMDFALDEFPILADAAEELGMNNGDYFWIWHDVIELGFVDVDNTNITKLLAGSAWVAPVEDFLIQDDPFFLSWYNQGPEFAERVNKANPIEMGEPGYVFANKTYFQDVGPDFGSGFMYDAVMSVGIGACIAQQTTNDTVSGFQHLQGIRRSDFHGATGRVLFGNKEDIGGRDGKTVCWAALNFYQNNSVMDFDFADVMRPGSEEWTQFDSDSFFVYRDGRTVPPDLLRNETEKNYLSQGLRILGLTLMSVAIFSSLVIAIWVYVHRTHRVLKAAQPHFLYIVCFGAAVQASTIFPISFDEGSGWSEKQLSRACMALPWLLTLGHIITFSALFSKLWRVNRVLQFARRKVSIRTVAWPSVLLTLGAILVLSLWTGLDSLTWRRTELNEDSGETIGQCHCGVMGFYLGLLIGFMLIPTVLTLIMAWKTKDVDDAYAEGWWIFIMVLVHLEVAVIAAPVVAILRDVSTDGRYLGMTLIFWTFPMSTLILIMLPKLLAYSRAVRGLENSKKCKRGETSGGVKISGLNEKDGSPRTPNNSSLAVEEELPSSKSVSQEEEIPSNKSDAHEEVAAANDPGEA